MNIELITKIALMVLVPFAFVALTMPYISKLAKAIGAVDIPGGRHIHTVPTPRLGGLGVFAGFILGYMLFGHQSAQMNSVLIGSFIIIITGIMDDIAELPVKSKLLGQTLAACIITFYGGILLKDVSAFGIYLDFGYFSYPLTIFFILGCINCINLIDGLDGLSGGICSIFFLTIAIIAIAQGRYNSLVLVLTLIMLGSTLGFLLHNFNPASIFAGDGATFMGFIIGVITLLEFKGPALISFFAPVCVLAIPILDTLFAIIRRLLKGQKPFQADREHLHHQLLGMQFSQRNTVLIIYLIDILFSIATLIFVLKDKKIGMILFIILFVIVLWFVLHTSIISEKNPKLLDKIKTKLKRS